MSRFLLTTATVLLTTTLAPLSHAGVVEEWNEVFLQAVRKETPPPCLVSRNMPIFHLAIHRAVQQMAKDGLGEEAQKLAAAHAADGVFRTFFPGQAKMAEELLARQGIVREGNGSAEKRAIIATPAATSAKPWLQAARDAVAHTFKEREDDGSATTVHYLPSEKPGQWRRTPPNFRPPEFPHWGHVRPFMVGDATQFRAPPPPALDSAAYAADVNLVKELGGKTSTRRTEEQTLIARFWADFSYTSSPPGHWNEIAREMSLQRRLSVGEAARVFAVLNTALADTCICIWDTKYTYNLWRPVTAIQRADEDGTPATVADPQWEPLLRTPPHPEYVSGHSGISGAAATVLEHFFGPEKVDFAASSDDVKDTKRSFTSFQTCAEEIAMSRVYGGIHFASAGREGLALGRKVAQKVIANFPQ